MNTKHMAPGLAALFLLGSFGCATRLALSEADRGIDGATGVVVNKRRVYQVQQVSVRAATDPGGQTIVGADPAHVLIVDVRRDLFASGGLKLKLTPTQTIKSLAIDSTPGTAAAAQGVTAIIQAPEKIE